MSEAHRTRSWGSFSAPFIHELADRLTGLRVLEVFAGNGLLAALLKECDVTVTATSVLSGQDWHEHGLLHPVEELRAREAVERHGSQHDVLLMSWPPANEAATDAAIAWGSERPIIFIGEITDASRGFAGLGGCASDLFFAITRIDREFATYRGRGSLDRAVEMHLDAGLLGNARAGAR